MGAERRKDPRVSCLIPCEVRRGSQTVGGTVRNVSSGGLSLHVDLGVEQGDVLHLCLQPDRGTQITVEAIVWHIQAMRERRTGRTLNRLGLVLSDAADDYVDLLQGGPSLRGRSARARRASPTRPPRPAAQSEPQDEGPKDAAESESSPPPTKYRVRVKHDSSPRTRAILVFAADLDAARGAAQTEIDPGWHVLEIERA